MIGKRSICIAEDHTLLRVGLKAMLASEPGLEVVTEAANGFELLDVIQKHQPELVLLDLSMPGLHGLEALQEVRRRYPEVKVLVLTMHDAEEYVLAALRAGAAGYILKDSTAAELVMAIHAALAGKSYLSPEISGKIVHSYLEGKKSGPPSSTWDTLTHREREILKLIAEGHKNKAIAECLHMSVKTVETHRTHLMRKLGVHSAAGLTAYAMERGLVNK